MFYLAPLSVRIRTGNIDSIIVVVKYS
jgi:hypothetical protein